MRAGCSRRASGVQHGRCTAAFKAARKRADPHAMAFDLALLGLLGMFTALGAWRGALESGLRLASWVLGYGIAVWAGAVFGDDLAARAAIPGWAGIPIAGTAAFLVVQALAAIGIAVARRRRRDREA